MAEKQTSLSILIPTLIERKSILKVLTVELNRQRKDLPVQLLILADNGEATIGEKRNRLLQEAKGIYVCFIDDDDSVSPDYIETLLTGIETNPDCISLRGEITIDGGKPEIFEHSLKYNKWETKDGAAIKYLRNPNHLNCIRASIAKQFTFPDKSHGEDHTWSIKINASWLLKTEYYTDRVLYYYKYTSKK